VYRQSNGVGDYVVKFDASGSTDPDNTVLSYLWDFDITRDSNGDGIPDNDIDSSSPVPAFDFKHEGTFNVKLTVLDADNGTSSSMISVSVKSVAVDNGSMTYIIAGTAIIAVVAAVAFLARRTRKKAPARLPPEERLSEPQAPASNPRPMAPPSNPRSLAPPSNPRPQAPPYGSFAAPAYGPVQSYPAYYAASGEDSQAPQTQYESSRYFEDGAPDAQLPAGGHEPEAMTAPTSAGTPVPTQVPASEVPLEPTSVDGPTAPETPKATAASDDISDIMKRLESITKSK
jgi:hypothetical protein